MTVIGDYSTLLVRNIPVASNPDQLAEVFGAAGCVLSIELDCFTAPGRLCSSCVTFCSDSVLFL